MIGSHLPQSEPRIEKYERPSVCSFDLDGTLIRQEHQHFYNAYCRIYRETGKEPPSFEDFQKLAKSFALFSDIQEDQRIAFKHDFWQRFNSTYDWPIAREMEGAIAVLDRFVTEGSKVAIVTARNQLPADVRTCLDRTGLLPYVHIISTFGEEHLRGSTSKVNQIRYVCSQLFVHPADSLIVGDRPDDIISGKEAGCGLTIGILNGSLEKQLLVDAKPDILTDSIGSLLNYFEWTR